MEVTWTFVAGNSPIEDNSTKIAWITISQLFLIRARSKQTTANNIDISKNAHLLFCDHPELILFSYPVILSWLKRASMLYKWMNELHSVNLQRHNFISPTKLLYPLRRFECNRTAIRAQIAKCYLLVCWYKNAWEFCSIVLVTAGVSVVIELATINKWMVRCKIG